jgi:hypothetical protein
MIAAVHLTAAISFAHVLEGWFLALAMCVLLLSSVLAIFRLRRHEPGQWVFAANGDLIVQQAADERLLRLSGSSTDFAWAIWLHWQDAADGRRGARMLTRDQFDPEVWRQIRVWLRHLASVAESSSAEQGARPG